MAVPVLLEIIGLKDSSCSPFPCDDTRSCGLSGCDPKGRLLPSIAALKQALAAKYGDRVEVRLTLIDEEVPLHVEEIIRTKYPPLPIILVNGELAKIGRISLPMIEKEVDSRL